MSWAGALQSLAQLVCTPFQVSEIKAYNFFPGVLYTSNRHISYVTLADQCGTQVHVWQDTLSGKNWPRDGRHCSHYPCACIYYGNQCLGFVFSKPHQRSQCSKRYTQHLNQGHKNKINEKNISLLWYPYQLTLSPYKYEISYAYQEFDNSMTHPAL